MVRTDYGVLHVDGATPGPVSRVVAYEEKPELDYNVSMGVYVSSLGAREHVPDGPAVRLPRPRDGAARCRRAGRRLHVRRYWLDIGRPDDYEQALEDYPTLLPRLFPDDGPRA